MDVIRGRSTSDVITDSFLRPDKWKGKAVETSSTWSNDPDPFAAAPTRHASPSRSSSPAQLRPTRAASLHSSSSLKLKLGPGIAGGTSAPPPIKKHRASLLVTASDTLFSFGTRRRASVSRKASISSPRPRQVEIDTAPIVDIRASPVEEPTDEAIEREELRNAAARSIGLGLPMAVNSIHPEDTVLKEEDDEYDLDSPEEQLSPLSPSKLGHDHLKYTSPPSAAPSIDSHPALSTAISRNLTNIKSAASSMASLGGDNTTQIITTKSIQHQQQPSMSPPVQHHCIPAYPCTLSSLAPFSQNASTLLRYYPGGSFFLSRSRQWKSRYLVLTSLKPISGPESEKEEDTQAHLHLFRSNGGDEKELERLKINEDSVVFVTDEGPEVSGKKYVFKAGGLDAGGAPVVKPKERTLVKDKAKGKGEKDVFANSTSNAVKVLWLLQCTDSAMMQRWIGFIKTGLLVQRAERAGLGSSILVAPSELNGDLDVLLSLRAQGLIPSPSTASPLQLSSMESSVNASTSSTVATSLSNSNDDTSPTKGRFGADVKMGRPRSSTNTAAVHALKGLFGSSGSVAHRPRSFSSGSRPTTPPAVTNSGLPASNELMEESNMDTSLGNRASALLNLSMNLGRRATSPAVPSAATTSPSLVSATGTVHTNPPLWTQPITPHDELKELEYADRDRMDLREKLNSQFNSSERPMSSGSLQLQPPPRTKRSTASSILGLTSTTASGVGIGMISPPRSPVLEQSLQEELKKVIFAPPPRPSLLEESESTPDGYEIRPSGEFSRPGEDNESLNGPFSGPSSALGHGESGVVGAGQSSISLGADFAASQVPRPPSVLSTISASSNNNAIGDTPSSIMQELAQSPVSAVPPSPISYPSTPSITQSYPSTPSITQSSPQRSNSMASRRLPKMLAPPLSAPPPPPVTSSSSPSSHPEDSLSSSVSGSLRDKENSANNSIGKGTSFFNPKRISTSSTGLSIRSFNSVSSSRSGRFGVRNTSPVVERGLSPASNSGNTSIRSAIHPPPRPTPNFAPPPAPEFYHHPFAAEPREMGIHPYALAEGVQGFGGSGNQRSSGSSGFSGHLSRSASGSPANLNGVNRLSGSSGIASPVRSEFSMSVRSNGSVGGRVNGPPSVPPPVGALPPRPDEHPHHHHRANSLSTIPASPPHRITDLPNNGALGSILPDVESPVISLAALPSEQNQPLSTSNPPTVSRHVSLKARLRMMSTPSPRSSIQSIPALATAPEESSQPSSPATNTITIGAPILGHSRSRSNTVEYSMPLTPPSPPCKPIIPIGTLDAPSPLSLPLSPPVPPVPPRSSARPKSPLIIKTQLSLGEEEQASQGRTLSPPPHGRASRQGRQSRELQSSMMATSSPVIPFKSQEEPMSPVPEISRSQEEGQEPIASVEDMEKLVSILEVHSIGEDVRDSGVAFT